MRKLKNPLKTMTAYLLMFAIILSSCLGFGVTLINSDSNDSSGIVEAEAATTTCRNITDIWFNGSPTRHPQANNTFRYADGGTDGRTFTSQYPPEGIELTSYGYNGTQEIRMTQPVPHVIFFDKFTDNWTIEVTDLDTLPVTADDPDGEYLGRTVESYIQRYISLYEAGPGSEDSNKLLEYKAKMQEVRDTWAAKGYDVNTLTVIDARCILLGYSGWDELHALINEMFWFRYMHRFTTGGQMSWCLQAQNHALGSNPQVDSNVIMGTEQRSFLLGLIVAAAADMGAANNDNVYCAAQVLIWELSDGLLNYSDLSHTGASGYYNGVIVGNNLQSQYEAIKAEVSRKRLIPSFLTSDFTYKRNGNVANTYYYGATWNVDHFDIDDELILTDYNGLVDKWTWTDTGVYHFEVIDANHLKVTADKYSEDAMGNTKFINPNLRSSAGAAVYAGGPQKKC